MTLASIDGVAHVERLGAPDGEVSLLVEVPHGADRRAHYDALRERLVGALPEDLHVFFHANTDFGAWQYGRRVAEQVVARAPGRSAIVVRCLVPRTFVDTNRLAEATDDLAAGGLTAGIPAYVRDPNDRALLLSMHRQYVELSERAFEEVCGAGGFGLMPHSYGPRTMGIAKVDDDIVTALRRAYEPEAWASWPERAPVDLITKDGEHRVFAPEGMAEALIAAYAAIGIRAVDSETYHLHPSTQGFRWSTRWPDRTLALEVRRDLLTTRFDLFDELEPDPDAIERIATPLADAIDAWLRGR